MSRAAAAKKDSTPREPTLEERVAQLESEVHGLKESALMLEVAARRMQQSVDVSIELSIVIGQGLGLSEKMGALMDRVRALRDEAQKGAP